MEAQDKLNLAARTRHRNASVWVSLDWGGLLDPLEDQQADLNTLGLGSIENYLAVSDEAWDLKEDQRDQSDALDQAEVAQARQLADDKVAMEREKLALKTATDDYVLAVRIYDAKVRDLLMGAKEYAAQVEREQLEVAEGRALLAIAKEELHQGEVNAKIYYEVIQRKQVEADLARAQVDVAKANIRALMADIEAGKAEVDLIEARTQKYVAEADKATLQADVAQIFAEIVTKKLSLIKLDVGRQEIADQFAYIQGKLDDTLALWETRRLVEVLKAEYEAQQLAEVNLNLLADQAQEDLREDAVDDAREVLEHEEDKTAESLAEETALTATHTAYRQAQNNAQLEKSVRSDEGRTAAQRVIDAARTSTYMRKQHYATNFETTYEDVEG